MPSQCPLWADPRIRCCLTSNPCRQPPNWPTMLTCWWSWWSQTANTWLHLVSRVVGCHDVTFQVGISWAVESNSLKMSDWARAEAHQKELFRNHSVKLVDVDWDTPPKMKGYKERPFVAPKVQGLTKASKLWRPKIPQCAGNQRCLSPILAKTNSTVNKSNWWFYIFFFFWFFFSYNCPSNLGCFDDTKVFSIIQLTSNRQPEVGWTSFFLVSSMFFEENMLRDSSKRMCPSTFCRRAVGVVTKILSVYMSLAWRVSWRNHQRFRLRLTTSGAVAGIYTDSLLVLVFLFVFVLWNDKTDMNCQIYMFKWKVMFLSSQIHDQFWCLQLSTSRLWRYRLLWHRHRVPGRHYSGAEVCSFRQVPVDQRGSVLDRLFFYIAAICCDVGNGTSCVRMVQACDAWKILKHYAGRWALECGLLCHETQPATIPSLLETGNEDVAGSKKNLWFCKQQWHHNYMVI